MSNDFKAIEDEWTFEEDVRDADNPVIVMFWTEWCKTCDESREALAEVAENYESVEVVTVEIDESARLANNHSIADVPTFLSFYGGNVLQRREKLIETDEIEEMFEYLMNLPKVAA